MYANPSGCPQCLVYPLDKYFCKFPPQGRDMDAFYLHCASKKPADGGKWYECSPVGKERLRNLKRICTKRQG